MNKENLAIALDAIEDIALAVSYALEENPDCDKKQTLEHIGFKARVAAKMMQAGQERTDE